MLIEYANKTELFSIPWFVTHNHNAHIYQFSDDMCGTRLGRVHIVEAQEGSPPQVTRSLFFKAPGHQVTFFHEKIKTTQVTGRFFKLSRSRGRPQNGPRSQVAKNPSWAS